MERNSVFRTAAFRFYNGVCCSIAITLLIHSAILFFTGTIPMLPEFAARFKSELHAYMAELWLIGLMSGITSAGTIVFDARRIGLVVQSIVFILIMLCSWLPVACFVWGFHKYTGSMISTIVSILVTYGLCLLLQYRHCKKEIEEINAKLQERKE